MDKNPAYLVNKIRHAIYSYAVTNNVHNDGISFVNFSEQAALCVWKRFGFSPAFTADYRAGNIVDGNFVEFSSFYPDVKNIEATKTPSLCHLEKTPSSICDDIMRHVEDFFSGIDGITDDVNICIKCEATEKFAHGSGIHFGSFCPVLFIGESPARNGWRVTGAAWKSSNGKTIPSGNVLNKLLVDFGADVCDIPFVEAIKCFQHERERLPTALANCSSILSRQIRLLRPVVIVPLGEKAAYGVLGGGFKRLSEIAGKVIHSHSYGHAASIIPAYHPSPISPKGYKDNIEIFNVIMGEIKNHGTYMWGGNNVFDRS